MRIFLLAVLGAGLVFGGADDTFLIRNATVHPISGPSVENASVLVKDGKIAEVGVKIAAPKGVRVIEGKGLHVYPGMIDSATQVGLSEISSVRETNDTGEIGEFNPQLRAVTAINPASEFIPVTRANGTTTAIVMPGSAGGGGGGGGELQALLGGQSSYILGQASLVNLDGWTWEEMEVRRGAALQMRLPQMPQSLGRFAALLGVEGPGGNMAEARRRLEQQKRQVASFFEDARRYQKAKVAKDAGFKTDLRFEAMLPVLEGKLPVMITATRERQIREAVAWAEKEKVKLVLAGVREPGKMAEELAKKKIPVIVGPTLALPLDDDDPYDAAFSLPAELHSAGVPIAFGSFGNQFARNLPYQVANAVAFGLPRDVALKAVTVTPAEIWGVAGEMGSIEPGKLANLMVTDGDPLETRTQVKHVFIRGKAADLETKHTRLYQKYLARP
ncbi:MAG: amidohydrolase family protein [Bryobacteraceae bacterium]|nr:amidohydrolase family protein [Bryobacteraceae bacterium]